MGEEIRLAAAALRYAEQGWNVFPVWWIAETGVSKEAAVCACHEAEDCTSPGKHPIPKSGVDDANNGVLDATDDLDTVDAWWRRYPNANIGVATGSVSGIVVVDIDGDKGGFPVWDRLCAAHDGLSLTAVSATGLGRHLVFRAPHGEIRNRKEFIAGVDFRGDGGYIIAPPSQHYTGKIYHWEVDPDEIEPMPDWLLKIVQTPRAKTQKSVPGCEATVKGWDTVTPEVIQDLCDSDPDFRRRWRRDKRLKNAGADASKVDFDIACMMIRHGIGDLDTVAFGLMASRHRDPDAWAQALQHKSPNYFALTAQSAWTEVTGQQEAREARADSLHPAWDQAFPWNGLGDTRRFLAIHGEDLLWHSLDKQWHVWDGTRFAGDDARDGGAMGIQTRLIRYLEDLKILAELTDDPDWQEKAKAHANKAGSAGYMGGMETIAHSEVTVFEAELDADAHLLNAPNGIIDLATGTLLPHAREHRQTKVCGVAYRPDATSDVWGQFLEEVLPDPVTRLFFQRCVGYSLLGSQDERRFFFCWGPTGTGKTTAISAIQSALGDYHNTADFSSFLRSAPRDGAAATPDMARLSRSRMVSAVETDHGGQLAEGMVKHISGGDSMTTRHLHAAHVEWKPRMALWLVANDRPKGRVDDDALWDRLVPFGFHVQIPKGQRDTRLNAKLASSPGVLAWMVQGAMDYLADPGLELPPECIAGVESYQQSSDPLNEWREECVGLGERLKCRKGQLWKSYKDWCRENEERGISARQFNRIMESQFALTGGAWIGVDIRTKMA